MDFQLECRNHNWLRKLLYIDCDNYNIKRSLLSAPWWNAIVTPSMSSHHFFITPPFHRDTLPPLAQTNAVVESLANSPVEGVSGSPPFTLVCLSGWLLSWGSQPLLCQTLCEPWHWNAPIVYAREVSLIITNCFAYSLPR